MDEADIKATCLFLAERIKDLEVRLAAQEKRTEELALKLRTVEGNSHTHGY